MDNLIELLETHKRVDARDLIKNILYEATAHHITDRKLKVIAETFNREPKERLTEAKADPKVISPVQDLIHIGQKFGFEPTNPQRTVYGTVHSLVHPTGHQLKVHLTRHKTFWSHHSLNEGDFTNIGHGDSPDELRRHLGQQFPKPKYRDVQCEAISQKYGQELVESIRELDEGLMDFLRRRPSSESPISNYHDKMTDAGFKKDRRMTTINSHSLGGKNVNLHVYRHSNGDTVGIHSASGTSFAQDKQGNWSKASDNHTDNAKIASNAAHNAHLDAAEKDVTHHKALLGAGFNYEGVKNGKHEYSHPSSSSIQFDASKSLGSHLKSGASAVGSGVKSGTTVASRFLGRQSSVLGNKMRTGLASGLASAATKLKP